MAKKNTSQAITDSVKIEHKSSPKKAVETKTSPQSEKKEINGPKGLEPTRYGDWESKGRCYDF